MSNRIPSADLVTEVLAQLARVAQAAGDTANTNALNRADFEVGKGVLDRVQVRADGDLLIPSKSDAGTVYRVGSGPCTCPAGTNGKPCWHVSLWEAIGVARELATQEADDEAAYLEAVASGPAPANDIPDYIAELYP